MEVASRSRNHMRSDSLTASAPVSTQIAPYSPPMLSGAAHSNVRHA